PGGLGGGQWPRRWVAYIRARSGFDPALGRVPGGWWRFGAGELSRPSCSASIPVRGSHRRGGHDGRRGHGRDALGKTLASEHADVLPDGVALVLRAVLELEAVQAAGG